MSLDDSSEINTMRSLLFIICCIPLIHAVVPMMSMVHRVHYSRTQYLLPCKVCVNALLEEMKSPSTNVDTFIEKAPYSCAQATDNHHIQQACVAVLKNNAYPLLANQRRGYSVHSSCLATFATDCTESQTKFAVLCDKRKKKGYCHTIPIN